MRYKVGALGREPIDALVRFILHTSGDGECTVWNGAKSDSGYGQFWDGRTMTRAHRFSFVQARGPIPNGLYIDHTCENRSCVNPTHLEAVTASENTRRHYERHPITPKEFCLRGHSIVDAPRYNGTGRSCLLCVKIRHKTYRDRKRAKKEAI